MSLSFNPASMSPAQTMRSQQPAMPQGAPQTFQGTAIHHQSARPKAKQPQFGMGLEAFEMVMMGLAGGCGVGAVTSAILGIRSINKANRKAVEEFTQKYTRLNALDEQLAALKEAKQSDHSVVRALSLELIQKLPISNEAIVDFAQGLTHDYNDGVRIFARNVVKHYSPAEPKT